MRVSLFAVCLVRHDCVDKDVVGLHLDVFVVRGIGWGMTNWRFIAFPFAISIRCGCCFCCCCSKLVRFSAATLFLFAPLCINVLLNRAVALVLRALQVLIADVLGVLVVDDRLNDGCWLSHIENLGSALPSGLANSLQSQNIFDNVVGVFDDCSPPYVNNSDNIWPSSWWRDLMTRGVVVSFLRTEENFIKGADLLNIAAQPLVVVGLVSVVWGLQVFFHSNQRLSKPNHPLVLEVTSRAWLRWLNL